MSSRALQFIALFYALGACLPLACSQELQLRAPDWWYNTPDNFDDADWWWYQDCMRKPMSYAFASQNEKHNFALMDTHVKQHGGIPKPEIAQPVVPQAAQSTPEPEPIALPTAPTEQLQAHRHQNPHPALPKPKYLAPWTDAEISLYEERERNPQSRGLTDEQFIRMQYYFDPDGISTYAQHRAALRASMHSAARTSHQPLATKSATSPWTRTEILFHRGGLMDPRTIQSNRPLFEKMQQYYYENGIDPASEDHSYATDANISDQLYEQQLARNPQFAAREAFRKSMRGAFAPSQPTHEKEEDEKAQPLTSHRRSVTIASHRPSLHPQTQTARKAQPQQTSRASEQNPQSTPATQPRSNTQQAQSESPAQPSVTVHMQQFIQINQININVSQNQPELQPTKPAPAPAQQEPQKPEHLMTLTERMNALNARYQPSHAHWAH